MVFESNLGAGAIGIGAARLNYLRPFVMNGVDRLFAGTKDGNVAVAVRCGFLENSHDHMSLIGQSLRFNGPFHMSPTEFFSVLIEPVRLGVGEIFRGMLGRTKDVNVHFEAGGRDKRAAVRVGFAVLAGRIEEFSRLPCDGMSRLPVVLHIQGVEFFRQFVPQGGNLIRRNRCGQAHREQEHQLANMPRDATHPIPHTSTSSTRPVSGLYRVSDAAAINSASNQGTIVWSRKNEVIDSGTGSQAPPKARRGGWAEKTGWAPLVRSGGMTMTTALERLRVPAGEFKLLRPEPIASAVKVFPLRWEFQVSDTTKIDMAIGRRCRQ